MNDRLPALGLSLPELVDIISVATGLPAGQCSPTHLRNLLTHRLGPRNRGLSLKVLCLTTNQLEALFSHVMDSQRTIARAAGQALARRRVKKDPGKTLGNAAARKDT
jgi:hypothetical protein